MKTITVQLPDPGPVSSHHEADQVVWHHGQYGEFVLDKVMMKPPLPLPIADDDGNAYSIKDLREMAYAALAAAEAAEAMGYPAN